MASEIEIAVDVVIYMWREILDQKKRIEIDLIGVLALTAHIEIGLIVGARQRVDQRSVALVHDILVFEDPLNLK